MSRSDEFPEDRVASARRNTLNEAEQHELRQLLATSPALRAALKVGHDFDRVCDMQIGDESRISHFVEGALRSRNRRPSFFPRLRTSRWLLAAAVLGVSGVAFGLRGYIVPVAFRSARVQPSAVVSSEKPGRAARTLARAQSAPTVETSAVTTPDLPASAQPTVAAPRRAIPAGSPRENAAPVQSDVGTSAQTPASPSASTTGAFTSTLGVEPSEPTAASLFATANQSRNQRHFDLAIFQFQELQRRFARSPEAVISRVSLGKVLLARGNASAALEQFTAYTNVGGPLMEEALVGRAQALFALGHTSEELRAWETLLAQFPRSVYGVQARNRLATQPPASR